MKKLVSTLSCVAIFASSSLFGQGSVATDPVGYVTVDVPAGTSLISLPMQKSKVFEGAVTGVGSGLIEGVSTDDALISADFSDLGTAFSYVQVVESTGALGAIASIISEGDGTITVDPPLSGLQVGDRIAVRPHITLDDVKGEPEFSDGTSLVVFTSNGSREVFTYFSSTFLGAPEGLWGDSNSEDASGVAILPSEGMVVSNGGAASKIVVVGAVSTDPLKYPFGGSFSVVGSLSPSDTVTVKEAFGDLPFGSTVSVRTADGLLNTVAVYEVVDRSQFGLGEGKLFLKDGTSDGDGDFITGGSAVIISPPSGTEGITLPAAYSANDS